MYSNSISPGMEDTAYYLFTLIYFAIDMMSPTNNRYSTHASSSKPWIHHRPT
jgi:hypothetical protein